MARRNIALISLAFVLINVEVNAQNPDVGKILIGAERNASDTVEYKFNVNLNSIGTFPLLLFSAVVESGVDGSVITKTDDIDVTCENEFDGVLGYTAVTFNTVLLPLADSDGIVTFTINAGAGSSPGRPAVVRCYGVSRSGTCPATTDVTLPQPQFCRDTSLSAASVTIALTPAPVVSVCESVNIVPVLTTPPYAGSLSVELSESVQGADVTVTCVQDLTSPTPTDCTSISGSISFTSTVNVAIGETTADIPYVISRSGVSEDVCLNVRCFAVSQGIVSPGNYLQYTEIAGSGTGVIRSNQPTVTFEPQSLTAYNSTFQTILFLDQDTEIDVAFSCQASVVGSLAEAQARVTSPDCNFIFNNGTTTTTPATTPATTTPTPTTLPPGTTDANATTGPPTAPTALPTPPPDPNSPWSVVNSSFIISRASRYAVVQTERTLLAIAAVQEIVVTTCCSRARLTGSPQSYINLAVASIAVANLRPINNNTGGVVSGTPSSERFIVKPAYREVAPCPCDLTYLQCDTGCCCDLVCTDAQKLTFACIPGLAGGLDPEPNLRSCQSRHFGREDWFPALCVETESNAFLGKFYDNTPKLSPTTTIDSTLAAAGKSHAYTYRETEASFTAVAPVDGYRAPVPLRTISSLEGTLSTLPLPRQQSLGGCLDSAPVGFLEDFSSRCPRALTRATCGEISAFNAQVFVESSSLFAPACPRWHISADGTATSLAEVTVNYYCATDPAPYLASDSTFASLVVPDTLYDFGSGALTVNNCSDPCGGETACVEYNLGREETDVVPLPPRCAADDGYTQQDQPSLLGDTCRNVVLDVRYRFTWAGQTITGLTADVVVGDVPVPTAVDTQVLIGQRFSASFSHSYSGPSNQTDNFQQLTTAYQRSGRPGYDMGKPVASGCSSTNATTGDPLPVDQSSHRQMAVWSPGVDGLCQNAARRFLTFGDDLQSSCALWLTFLEIGNCDSLKLVISNHLNVLMPANTIGRYGYNDPGREDMWITVLRKDPFPQEEVAPTTNTTTAATPTTTLDPNATAEAVPFDPLTQRGGVCRDLLSGVHLEVMYADTGVSNGSTVTEIIGAQVSFTVSNWTMPCDGPGSADRCRNASAVTRPFLLTSSVRYTKVSATTPQKDILFYEKHKKDRCDSDTCYRFFDDFDRSTCHYDTCWHELVYPLTRSWRGYQSVHYTRGFTLVCVVFAIAYLAVTKPWK